MLALPRSGTDSTILLLSCPQIPPGLAVPPGCPLPCLVSTLQVLDSLKKACLYCRTYLHNAHLLGFILLQ